MKLITMKNKITRETFKLAAEELSNRDPDVAMFYTAHGIPSLRSRPTGYGTLLKIICGQQVSTAAARAITSRLDKLSNPFTPEIFLGLSKRQIRKIGLSRQKENYARGIAEAVMSGEFRFRKIAYLNDEEAIQELTKLKGIGRWTAEVYLLFALRRPDIWPVDDLGVVKGLMGLKGFSERPSRHELIEIGELYRPWRSVAARMMWHYSNIIRCTGQTD